MYEIVVRGRVVMRIKMRIVRYKQLPFTVNADDSLAVRNEKRRRNEMSTEEG